jgi:hypothetical protein
MSPKRIVSIITGSLSALGLAYLGLAQIWGLPFANEVNESVAIVVQLLSTVLAVVTVTSVIAENGEDNA